MDILCEPLPTLPPTRVGSIYSMDTLDIVMIHVHDRTECEGTRFYHTTQNSE